DAGQDEGPDHTGLPGGVIHHGGEARARSHREIQRPLSRGDGMLGARPRGVSHLSALPEAHHRRIRTTNRLERLNGESRRRTKVIPRFPTERSCLTLHYASLMAASQLWRGIPMTAAMLRQLAQLRAETTPTTKEEAVA